MATGTNGRIALMSIHPQYARAILDGTKEVEFRKRPLAPDTTHVVIYSTKPDGAISGAFKITFQKTLPKTQLWENFREVGRIEETPFFDYFKNHDEGVAIGVGDTYRLRESIALTELGITTAPQSYQYLPDGAATRIFGRI